MQRFTCDCGHVLFFDNVLCPHCNHTVGYEPTRRVMARLIGNSPWKQCTNASYGVCNWLLPARSGERLCESCRMNQMVPDLTDGENKVLWARMEAGKRRLLYSFGQLGIRVPCKKDAPRDGLAFVIISANLNPTVTTGHLDGVITVNLQEADDTYRQFNRQQFAEQSRTLLGHFRHESAHYLWGRFLSNLNWGDPLRMGFRTLFGDEWTEYGPALERHYRYGANTGWEKRYISAYAASHPWEDWAETWGHYLQIIDGLETCEALGIHSQALAVPLEMLPGEAGTLPRELPQSGLADGAFLALLQRWMCVSTVLNEIAHSLGEPPVFPFLIPVPVAQKLRLAHHLAGVWGTGKFSIY